MRRNYKYRDDVSSLFNRYAGREIEPTRDVTRTVVVDGKEYSRTERVEDPTLEEMRKIAKAEGLELQFIDAIMTCDIRNDRVWSRLEALPNGKWKIGTRFWVG